MSLVGHRGSQGGAPVRVLFHIRRVGRGENEHLLQGGVEGWDAGGGVYRDRGRVGAVVVTRSDLAGLIRFTKSIAQIDLFRPELAPSLLSSI